ncbi:MAG: hypothetical protein FP825_06595 [Hyphomonas sp.]|uniref:hypothetical protein n=1 Tax=Hyphomonas sp. TaxID=87 RepID=UPI00178E7FD7|nr:hypothetical protein [Hyphomonas sp.]MBA3068128.1 hypothetical protein [Hyphomonas sp.]MBU3922025.1 hypothetical protein [Alphaproteobacteria bacterium]MBU4061137.1 hypothetical protein [Alphaproteobacteria bacterium]MBU4162861.1 hypothetical protein [Alphaproteobacteria bacterium]
MFIDANTLLTVKGGLWNRDLTNINTEMLRRFESWSAGNVPHVEREVQAALKFVRQLPEPEFLELFKSAEREDDASDGYHKTVNQRAAQLLQELRDIDAVRDELRKRGLSVPS